MPYFRPLLAGLLVLGLSPGSLTLCLARNKTPVRARPAVILRAREGAVEVRCYHTPARSWRGVELHPGDTLRVGARGWASLSIEASGARFLLEPLCSVRVESSRLYRLAGPLPRRTFDLPSPDPTAPGTTAPAPNAGR
jgi:hypothetical protein